MFLNLVILRNVPRDPGSQFFKCLGSGHGGIKDFTSWEPRELTKYFARDSVIRRVEHFLKSLTHLTIHKILDFFTLIIIVLVLYDQSVFGMTKYHSESLQYPPEPTISVSPSAVTLLLCLYSLTFEHHSVPRFLWLTHNKFSLLYN